MFILTSDTAWSINHFGKQDVALILKNYNLQWAAVTCLVVRWPVYITCSDGLKGKLLIAIILLTTNMFVLVYDIRIVNIYRIYTETTSVDASCTEELGTRRVIYFCYHNLKHNSTNPRDA